MHFALRLFGMPGASQTVSRACQGPRNGCLMPERWAFFSPGNHTALEEIWKVQNPVPEEGGFAGLFALIAQQPHGLIRRPTGWLAGIFQG